MPSRKTIKPAHVSNSIIKVRPFNSVKLAKRLEPLPHLAQVIIQPCGAKEFVIRVGAKDQRHLGISVAVGGHLPLQVDEHAFRELYLWTDIDHPDYRLDFDLRGRAWKEERDRWQKNHDEARKTMWIHVAVLQIAKYQEELNSNKNILDAKLGGV